MALITLTTTKKNDVTYAETELYNTEKIVDFRAVDATTIEFFYNEIDDRREKTNSYQTASTKAAFEALFNEALYVERVDLPILEIYSPAKRTLNTVLNVKVADVIKAKDIDATTSYLTFARGAFAKIKVKVDATIAEIETATSTSESIAI